MVLPPDWIEHRRAGRRDARLDRPGRRRLPRPRPARARGDRRTSSTGSRPKRCSTPSGIGYLADRYALRLPDGTERPVRIAEASVRGVTVVADEFGAASAVGATLERFRLAFPVPEELRPL